MTLPSEVTPGGQAGIGGSQLVAGAVVGRYKVMERVGGGNWATVYRAVDTRLDRPVALKVMTEGDVDARERLMDEISSIGRLQHPGIVMLHDSGETGDGLLYVAMAWASGGSLAQRLSERGVLEWPEAARIGLQLAEALAHAHGKGLLHRDLKPENVLFHGDGRATLTDFGVAGLLTEWRDRTELTRSGFVVGTPAYMSPEQLTGRSHSPATDVFGLGLLLFRMLFGPLPDADSVQDLVFLRLMKDLEVPERADVPEALRSLLRQMLRRNEQERIATADDVAATLRAVLDEPGAGDAVGSAGDAGTRRPPRPAASRSRGPSWRAMAAGAAGTLVLALVAVALFRTDIDLAEAFAVGLGLSTGVLFIAGGLAAGWTVARVISHRRSTLDRDASQILAGTRDRTALTATIAFRVDQLIARTQAIDAQVLGATIVQMVHEYDQAKASSERQAALMNTAQLLEKLMTRLSPWYVRHDKAVATTVSALGIVSGVLKIVTDVIRLLQGG
jgi:eukaryotic-like serine/threonine-protein kinase